MTKSEFLRLNPIGALLRTYATKEEDVPKRVQMVFECAQRLLATHIEGQRVVRTVEIVVWRDSRYADADCGLLIDALREAMGEMKHVNVYEGRHGDLFCGVLNAGIASLYRQGMASALIVSPDVLSYVNNETLISIVDMFMRDGVRVVGVAIEELQASVCEGRVANTFALWDIRSLQTVGGFDLRAAKAVNPKNHRRTFQSAEGKTEPLHGVEEILPLIRLVEAFGPKPIGVVLPRGEGQMQYIVPDPDTQPELYARHRKKMGTKSERQAEYCKMEDVDFSFLRDGVAAVD